MEYKQQGYPHQGLSKIEVMRKSQYDPYPQSWKGTIACQVYSLNRKIIYAA
jgi:hypothetical protein